MKKIMTLFLALFVIAGSLTAASSYCYADGETISITPDRGNAAVGETVTYQIGFSSNDSGSVFQGSLSYDASCLRPVSSETQDINLDNGSVVFGGSGAGGKVTFEVIGAGNGSVSINGEAAVSGVKTSVGGSGSVVCAAAAPQPSETEAPQSQAPAATQPAQTQAPAATQAPTQASTAAKTAGSSASEETANVVVQSEELRKAAPDEEGTSDDASAEETTALSDKQEDSSELKLADSLDGVAIPEGAEQISYTYHGTVYQVAKTSDGLILLPVQTEDGSVVWYVYNETTDVAIPYTRFSNLEELFVIIPPDDDVEIPEEFDAVPILLDGKELPAWKNPGIDDENMYFVYAINSKGEKAIYRFDGDAGLLMRYVPDVIEPETVETEPQTDDPELVSRLAQAQSQESLAVSRYQALSQEHEQSMMYRALIIIGLAAISLIFLLIIAVLAVKLRRKGREEDDREEEEDEVHYSESGIRVRQRDRVDRDAYVDTRRESREEGTSPVRPVRRPSRETQNERMVRTSTTSEVKPAERTRRPAAVRESVRREQDMPERRRRPAVPQEEAETFERRRPAAQERPARRDLQERRVQPAKDGEERRVQPAKDAQERKTQAVRRRTVSSVTETAAGNGESVQAEQPVRRRKRPVQNWEEEKQPDVTVDLTAEKQDTAEDNMTESVKVVTKKPVTKPVVEDLFEDEDSGDNDDFDITDFKNI